MLLHSDCPIHAGKTVGPARTSNSGILMSPLPGIRPRVSPCEIRARVFVEARVFLLRGGGRFVLPQPLVLGILLCTADVLAVALHRVGVAVELFPTLALCDDLERRHRVEL